MKSVFNEAQKNGSFLWQTVISFDNRWLAEKGLYDFKTKVLDEKQVKEVATIAINKMLQNEKMHHAVWSASIHYNTDNIHVHVGTVEPIPTRERKIYAQYDYVLNNKNRLEKGMPILDQNGNPVFKEEYRGKFKLKSLELCKQHVVNEISNSKEQNFQINRIIREVIVKAIKSRDLTSNTVFFEMFLRLYHKMPDCSENQWNYNNNIMAPLKKDIDNFSKAYLKGLQSFEPHMQIEKDKEKEKFMEQENEYAQYTLGKMYMYGNGVIINKLKMR